MENKKLSNKKSMQQHSEGAQLHRAANTFQEPLRDVNRVTYQAIYTSVQRIRKIVENCKSTNYQR